MEIGLLGIECVSLLAKGEKMKEKEIIFQKHDKIKVIAETDSYIDSLKPGKKYILTIKEKKNARSLNANNYFWKLCDELAAVLNISKTELYRSYIKEIGGNYSEVMVKKEAVEETCRYWNEKGLGWIAEIMSDECCDYVCVWLYYGSSVYTTEQMSRLIHLIVQDCIEAGIPTLETIELDRLCEEWWENG